MQNLGNSSLPMFKQGQLIEEIQIKLTTKPVKIARHTKKDKHQQRQTPKL